MEKVCVVLWRGPDLPAQQVEDWTTSALLPALARSEALRAATLHVESAEHDALRYGAAPDGELLTALVSVWVDSYQDIAELEPVLATAPTAARAAYLVCESVPTPYGEEMTWPAGKRSPGLSLVTLLDKPAQVPEAEFYRMWHVVHRRTTAEVHPFSSYVRNEVARPLTTGAPTCRGIVTESSTDSEDLLDQHRFYVSGGDAQRLRDNQKRVWSETSQFIDYDTIQVAPMSEVVVRPLAPTSP